jgi:hypothetical protein
LADHKSLAGAFQTQFAVRQTVKSDRFAEFLPEQIAFADLQAAFGHEQMREKVSCIHLFHWSNRIFRQKIAIPALQSAMLKFQSNETLLHVYVRDLQHL